MNKAQKEFVKAYYNDPFFEQPFVMTEKTLLNFAERYSAIDPTPDPVKYKIMFKSTFDTPEWVENLPGAESYLEDCSEYLKKTINYIESVIEYRENEYLKIRDGDVIHEFKIVLA